MHCIERAWERYAVTLSEADVRALERQIAQRQSVMVRRELNQTEEHLVRHGQVVLIAVYGLEREGTRLRIITFLPEEAIMKGNQQRRLLADQQRNRGHRGGRHRHSTCRRVAQA